MTEHDDGAPDLVAKAVDRARELESGYSCEYPVGRLPATPAAAVPRGRRILELGAGAGVGAAWIVSDLGDRTDVTVRTVELDAALAAEDAGDLPEGGRSDHRRPRGVAARARLVTTELPVGSGIIPATRRG